MIIRCGAAAGTCRRIHVGYAAALSISVLMLASTLMHSKAILFIILHYHEYAVPGKSLAVKISSL
jgi:hypothetical protein